MASLRMRPEIIYAQHLHKHIDTCVHAYIHTRTHTHIHIYALAPTCISKQSRRQGSAMGIK